MKIVRKCSIGPATYSSESSLNVCLSGSVTIVFDCADNPQIPLYGYPFANLITDEYY